MTTVAALLGLTGVGGLLAHQLTPVGPKSLTLSAFAPYLMLSAVLSLLIFLFSRLWVGVIAMALVVALAAAMQLPLYVASAVPGDAVRFVVMTANLRLGEADPRAVVAAVHRHQVDLLMLEELTPQEQDGLQRAGLDALLPHYQSQPREGAAGTGLWTRLPLSETRINDDFKFSFVSGKIRIPDHDRPVVVAATHMSGPVPNDSNWRRDIIRLRNAELPRLAREAGAGSVIVGGDFNATPDVGQFRALLSDGYADAAAQAGAGITPTFPANRWFPPLIAIDHVLTRNAVAASAKTVEIPGSDHRALVVSVAVAK